MRTRILVGHDGTAFAQSAVDYACLVARHFGAGSALRIVHYIQREMPAMMPPTVGDFPPVGTVTPDEAAALAERWHERMHELLGEAKGFLEQASALCEAKGVKHEQHVRVAGGTIAGLADAFVTDARLADLIVIGKGYETREGRMSELVEKLAPASVRPILLAPEAFEVPQEVILFYDGGPQAARALPLAAQWGVVMGWPVSVVTVMGDAEGAERIRNEAVNYLEDHGAVVRATHVPPGDGVDHVLEKVTLAHPTALVVKGAYAAPTVLRWIFGSTTATVVTRTDNPVLLVA